MHGKLWDLSFTQIESIFPTSDDLVQLNFVFLHQVICRFLYFVPVERALLFHEYVDGSNLQSISRLLPHLHAGS